MKSQYVIIFVGILPIVTAVFNEWTARKGNGDERDFRANWEFSP